MNVKFSKFLLPSLMLLVALFGLTVSTHPVSALSNGTLYINPPHLPNQPIGTTLQYQVKVFNMPSFNTWDIQVAVDGCGSGVCTILNPTAIDLTVNTLTANFSVTTLGLTSCINGAGAGCSPATGDGPGVVHSAILPLGDPPLGSIITGVLFTITYSVVSPLGATGFTTVHLGPTAPALADAGIPVPVPFVQDGSYGTPLPHATTTAVTCPTNVIVINQASLCNATVTDTSVAPTAPTTPSGTVTFTATGPVTPLTSSCTLVAGIAGTAVCTTPVSFTGTATGAASVSAAYGGDAQTPPHLASSSTVAAGITVNLRTTTTTVTCGSPVVINQASSCNVVVADTSTA